MIAPGSLIDPALTTMAPGTPYRPREVLPPIDDRLLEPTIDDPPIHLDFIPEVHGYASRSRIGERTRSRMFGQRENAERLAKLSEHVRALVASEGEAGLDTLKALIGLHFYIDAYARFWRSVGVSLATRNG